VQDTQNYTINTKLSENVFESPILASETYFLAMNRLWKKRSSGISFRLHDNIKHWVIYCM